MNECGSNESPFDRLSGRRVVLVACGVGNSYFSDQSLLYRVLGISLLPLVAGLVALQTAKGAAFWELVKGSRTEIRKVVGPPPGNGADHIDCGGFCVAGGLDSVGS